MLMNYKLINLNDPLRIDIIRTEEPADDVTTFKYRHGVNRKLRQCILSMKHNLEMRREELLTTRKSELKDRGI